MNKVVARLTDGQMVKGAATDFSTTAEVFHVTRPLPAESWNREEIHREDLKALFFVRDFDGDSSHVEKRTLEAPPAPWERGVQVTFNDGEVLVGTTPRYRGPGAGIFLVPADPESNNLNCYIPEDSAREIRFF